MPDFVVADFLAIYPQFSGFTNAQIQDIYKFEALVVGSKIIALFRDVDYKYRWSWIVLAHILTRYQLGLSGIVSSAGEGSVSGGFDNTKNEDANWWCATTFGNQCWQLVRKRGGATFIGTGYLGRLRRY